MLPKSVLRTTLDTNVKGRGDYYRSQDGWKQKPPYDLVLPYKGTTVMVIQARSYDGSFFGIEAKAGTTGTAYLRTACADLGLYYENRYEASEASARERLVGKLGERMQWAANLAELDKSFQMIAKRATQLRRFTKALRRWDLPGAARELNLPSGADTTARIGRFRRSRGFGNTFLEFHFGWEPLVKDIYGAVDVIQGPYPSGVISAWGKRESLDMRRVKVTSSEVEEAVWTGYLQSRMGASFHVENPFLYLASQMGLTNPISVAWELVPFSFVVDWFSTVGQFLGQLSDFHGLVISKPFTTTVVRLPSTLHTRTVKNTGQWWVVEKKASYMVRKDTLASVKLAFRPLTRVSPIRAATAVSLLTKGLATHS